MLQGCVCGVDRLGPGPLAPAGAGLVPPPRPGRPDLTAQPALCRNAPPTGAPTRRDDSVRLVQCPRTILAPLPGMAPVARLSSLATLDFALSACAGQYSPAPADAGVDDARACPAPNPGLGLPTLDCDGGLRRTGQASCVDGQWVCEQVPCEAAVAFVAGCCTTPAREISGAPSVPPDDRHPGAVAGR